MNKKLCEGIVYLLVLSQAVLLSALATDGLPHFYADNIDTADSDPFGVQNKDVEQWITQSTTSVSETIKNKTNAADYVKNYAHSYSQSLGNQYIAGGNALSPSARFRGGITLDDNFKFKSVDADLLIPVYETTSSILFGQLGLRTHDKSSFDGRAFLNTGIGYRHDVDSWMLGINAFVDSDVKNNNVRGSVGAEAFRGYLSFAGNYYFLLTDWKESKAHDLHDDGE